MVQLKSGTFLTVPVLKICSTKTTNSKLIKKWQHWFAFTSQSLIPLYTIRKMTMTKKRKKMSNILLKLNPPISLGLAGTKRFIFGLILEVRKKLSALWETFPSLKIGIRKRQLCTRQTSWVVYMTSKPTWSLQEVMMVNCLLGISRQGLLSTACMTKTQLVLPPTMLRSRSQLTVWSLCRKSVCCCRLLLMDTLGFGI